VKVFWTPEALQDRIDIWDFVAADNPLAAANLDAIFSTAASRLAEQPQIGRIGKTMGTRELVVHASYRMVYEISNESVWILALIHTSRLWPLVR
jgi:toxin ParE1/3/4